MIKWIKANWADPVWSKVFASLILSLLGLIGASIYSLYKQIPFAQLIQELQSVKIELSLFVCVLLFILFLAIIIPMGIISIKHFELKRPNSQNNPQLSNLLSGQWFLQYNHSLRPSDAGGEPVNFKDGNQYYAWNELKFILKEIKFNDTDKTLTWGKIKFQSGESHSTENLRIIDSTTLRGTDSLGYNLEYKKVA